LTFQQQTAVVTAYLNGLVMTARDLFAVAIGAMAVWLLSRVALFILERAIGAEIAHLIVGILLLAIAGFVAGSVARRK
jgi:hypothetical protein